MPNDTIDIEPVLLQRLKEGDWEAFDSIYRKYWTSLLDAAYKRLGNRQQSEDLVQDVFFRLWSKRADLAISNLGAYLHTAIHYEVISFVTRKKDVFSFYEPFEALLMESSDTPENQLIGKELLELVYLYAETLPEKRKEIFLLHINSKLSTKEIAALLAISQKTVQNQLGTALNGLRDQLTPAILVILASHF